MYGLHPTLPVMLLHMYIYMYIYHLFSYFRENLDLNTLIYTAVEYNCQWAVRLILDKGSAHLDGW